jgi:hypothetical protein
LTAVVEEDGAALVDVVVREGAGPRSCLRRGGDSREGGAAIHSTRGTWHRAITLVRRWGAEVRGQIDDKFAVDYKIVGRLFQVPCQHLCRGDSQYLCVSVLVKNTTISAYVQINHVANADIDDSEKPLVLLLELLLIKNLYCKYAVFSGFPGRVVSPHCVIIDEPRHLHVENLVPVRVQCFLDDGGRSCLLAADCRNCEGVGKS